MAPLPPPTMVVRVAAGSKEWEAVTGVGASLSLTEHVQEPITGSIAAQQVPGTWRGLRPGAWVVVDAVVAGVAAALLLPVTMTWLFVACWLLAMTCTGAYADRRGGAAAMSRSLPRVAVGGILVVESAALVLGEGIPRLRLLVALLVVAAAGAAGRGVEQLCTCRSCPPRRMVLVGEFAGVSRALAELGQSGRGVQQPVAACLLGGPPRFDLGVPVALGTDSVPALVRRHAADVVLVVPSAELSPPTLRRLVWSLEDTDAELFLATGLLDVAAVRTRPTVVGQVAALHISRAELHGARRTVKEAVERIVALVACVVLAPLLLVLMVVVRLDSPGPAIYRQQRIGLRGRPFTMLKLRTMVAGAEARVPEIHELNQADGLLFKVHGDPRVTGIGRFLRRYSLDELPQLWNIVVGEMALVGPRPPLPSEVVNYDEDVRRRMAVKPGLTGLWQVSGRSDLGWEESVRLDLHYVDNWSLWLDLFILCRTARAVLGHRGAY